MKNTLTLTTKLDESILTKMNNDEKRIIIASKHFIPFSQYDNEAKQKLAQLLIELSYFVGIKEPQTAESLKLLVKFLCSQFPHMTKEELHEAVNMTCSGKFGDIEHYQSFSPIYLGKIINAYNKYTIDAKKKYEEMLRNKDKEAKREEAEKNYNRYRGAYEVLVKEYATYLKDKKEQADEDYVADSDKLGIKAYQVKICCKMLLRIGFFSEEQLKSFDGDEYAIVIDYFVSLPKNYQEAITKIKQDMYVCRSRNDKKD